MATCKDCLHQCYTECLTEEPCNFFLDKAEYVPVVRCGECLFKRPRKEYGELHCCILDAPMNNNDFCSCGERRSDGELY